MLAAAGVGSITLILWGSDSLGAFGVFHSVESVNCGAILMQSTINCAGGGYTVMIMTNHHSELYHIRGGEPGDQGHRNTEEELSLSLATAD